MYLSRTTPDVWCKRSDPLIIHHKSRGITIEKENINRNVSHIETDHLRATFIDDDPLFENLGGEITKDSIMISLDDGTHPAYEGAEIKLKVFQY